ncbi:MAG: TIGR00303 family protein [Candidatus Nitrosothermus koennekii]|nr:MAG: TIGR00303 family protein [Candidatus Nitrosothermus koennekii]
MDMIKLAYNEDKGREFIDLLKHTDPLFLLAISYTETSEIDGITIAGAVKELIKYTPPADAEFIHYGYCRCIDTIPVTPDGKPTPALLTRAALKAADIPMLVVDAGSKVKPNMPYISIDAIPSKNIENEDALDRKIVDKIYNNSIELGRTISKLREFVIIGESIPGGTTTALAVLLSMGIDAKFKVSSSMPENPHDLKIRVVDNAMKRVDVTIGALRDKPLDAVAKLGDAMMITVAGIAIGLSKKSKVMLAGGTQMAAVLSLIKSLDYSALPNISIGTTRYIIDDKNSNLIDLIKEIYDVPIITIDPMLDRSSKDGLKAYANGFVKEGAGAGGASIAASLRIDNLLDIIEREYDICISHS